MKVTYLPSYYEGTLSFEDIQAELNRTLYALLQESAPPFYVTKWRDYYFQYDLRDRSRPIWWLLDNTPLSECRFIKVPKPANEIKVPEYYHTADEDRLSYGPYWVYHLPRIE